MTFNVSGWSGGARVPVNYSLNVKNGGGGQRSVKVFQDNYTILNQQYNYGNNDCFAGYNYGNCDYEVNSMPGWTKWLIGLGTVGNLIGQLFGVNNNDKTEAKTQEPEKKIVTPEKPETSQVTKTEEPTKIDVSGTVKQNKMYNANSSNQKLWAQLCNLFERTDGKPMTYSDGMNIKHAIDQYYGHSSNDISFANGGYFDLTAIEGELGGTYTLRSESAKLFNDTVSKHSDKWENTDKTKDAGYTATLQDNLGSGSGETAEAAKDAASQNLNNAHITWTEE